MWDVSRLALSLCGTEIPLSTHIHEKEKKPITFGGSFNPHVRHHCERNSHNVLYTVISTLWRMRLVKLHLSSCECNCCSRHHCSHTCSNCCIRHHNSHTCSMYMGCDRPTQSVMYVPLQVNRFHESISLACRMQLVQSQSRRSLSNDT